MVTDFVNKLKIVLHNVFKENNKPLIIKGLKGVFVVPPGIEPGTHGFSVHCSTN